MHPPRYSPYIYISLKHKRTRNAFCHRYIFYSGSRDLINIEETCEFCITKLMPKFNSCFLQYTFILHVLRFPGT